MSNAPSASRSATVSADDAARRHGVGTRREVAGLAVREDVQRRPRRVEERGIGIGVAVEVGPRERATRPATPANMRTAVHVPSPLLRSTTGVASHAPQRRCRGRRPSRRRPATRADARHVTTRRRRGWRLIGERAVGVLEQAAGRPPAPATTMSDAEVVVPVERQRDAVGGARSGHAPRRASRAPASHGAHRVERPPARRSVRPSSTAASRPRRQRRRAQRSAVNASVASGGDGVARRGRQRDEAFDRLRDQLGRRPHGGEALDERRHARQHVAQERASVSCGVAKSPAAAAACSA